MSTKGPRLTCRLTIRGAPGGQLREFRDEVGQGGGRQERLKVRSEGRPAVRSEAGSPSSDVEEMCCPMERLGIRNIKCRPNPSCESPLRSEHLDIGRATTPNQPPTGAQQGRPPASLQARDRDEQEREGCRRGSPGQHKGDAYSDPPLLTTRSANKEKDDPGRTTPAATTPRGGRRDPSARRRPEGARACGRLAARPLRGAGGCCGSSSATAAGRRASAPTESPCCRKATWPSIHCAPLGGRPQLGRALGPVPSGAAGEGRGGGRRCSLGLRRLHTPHKAPLILWGADGRLERML